MLVRILQFLIGALLAGGGGYLAWTHRSAGMNIFPPEAGMPWLVIAGVLGLCAGVVFLVSAVHPRPNTRALAAARAARRDETMGAAEAYYSQKDSGRDSRRDSGRDSGREARRERAADSDWRSGEIAPPAAPVAPPASDAVKMVEPVRAAPVVPVTPVVTEKPQPEKPQPEKPQPEKPQVVAPVVAPAPIVEAAPPPPPPAAKPVATSAPPEQVLPPLFPSTATLAPIPAAAEPPPALVVEKPAAPVTPPAPEKPQVVAPLVVETPLVSMAAASAPAVREAEPVVEAPSPAPVSAGPVAEGPAGAGYPEIRAALATGEIDKAERLLNTARETAQGLDLAELTGLAGDHAAKVGRASTAKWLWRLALKRFGELGAIDTPVAQAVAESLRVAG